jgi:hypothetical protein
VDQQLSAKNEGSHARHLFSCGKARGIKCSKPPKWIINQLHVKENAMPVIIRGIKKQILVRTGRGGPFDTAVTELVPSIAKFRSAGFCDIRKLAEQLNGAGLTAPSGRPFSYGTLRRVLIRQAELKLGPGPRTQSVAAGGTRGSERYIRASIRRNLRASNEHLQRSVSLEEYRRVQAYQRGGD